MSTALSSPSSRPGAAGDTASGLLGTLSVLRITGVDAASFLQGQVSNDTSRLQAADRALLAAYSTPQGRVLCVMTLLPHSSGLLAILPRELLDDIAGRLRKYVLRAKVKIDTPGEALCVAVHHGAEDLRAAGLAVPSAANGYAESAGIGIARRASSERFYVIGAAADLQAHTLAGADNDVELIDNAWRLAEIRDGLPQIYTQTREAFVAQMLNLDLLDGISFTKGCYTGQEIVARTQHLGRIKRRMFHLRLAGGVWTIGQALRLLDGRTGRLVELAEVAQVGEAPAIAVEALAVLTLEPGADGGAEGALAGIAAEQLPLPYTVPQSA